jgi:Undecaprenyl-phosphate glucose phosphotransferase
MSDAPADRSYREYTALPYLTFSRSSEAPFIRIRPAQLQLFVAAFELAVVMAMTLAAAIGYHLVVFEEINRGDLYAFTSLGLAVTYCIVAALRGHYFVRRLESAEASALSAFNLFNILFAIFVCVLFMSRMTDIYSRASLALQYGVTCSALVLGRVLLARAVNSAVAKGRIEARRVTVIGTIDEIEAFVEGATSNRSTSVISSVELPHWAAEPLRDDEQAQLDAFASQMTARLRDDNIDDIVILLPWSAAASVEILAKRLTALPATIQLLPRSDLSWFRAPALTRIGSEMGLSLSRPPLTVFDQAAKRIFDIVLAVAILIAVAPLMVMIAIAIRAETGGAVLFLQQRHGFNQKPFKILKFRTMSTADDGDRVVQATAGDLRVTSVGRILRRSSLDELPQLFNVLRGDMSLVGPRPHALAHTREYEEKIAFYAHRHNVKPGLTGWAQVNGFRGETDAPWKMQKRVEHDLYYIDNWSLMLDFKILMMTALSEKTFKNAI